MVAPFTCQTKKENMTYNTVMKLTRVICIKRTCVCTLKTTVCMLKAQIVAINGGEDSTHFLIGENFFQDLGPACTSSVANLTKGQHPVLRIDYNFFVFHAPADQQQSVDKLNHNNRQYTRACTCCAHNVHTLCTQVVYLASKREVVYSAPSLSLQG